MGLGLGLNTGFWASAAPSPTTLESILEAERLGFDSIWTSEAYGCDVLTPLAWWGSQTERVRLGTSIMQMSARRPTAAAMAAITMDHLSGGRFILGLGVSGPQVVEGWYGEPFAKPLARTREYVQIVRDVIARETRVASDGPHYPLPVTGRDGVTGLGKPLKTTVHPLRDRIPIFLGAEGPKNIAQTAEIADGWLALFYSPQHHDELYRPHLEEGFARRSRPRDGLRDRGLARLHRPRRCRGGGGHDPPPPGPVLRRDGRSQHELPSRGRGPHGLRGGGLEDPAALPRWQEGRGGRRGADEAGRAAIADRAAGQDPPRPRGVARLRRHLAADRWRVRLCSARRRRSFSADRWMLGPHPWRAFV